jgi:hypothetical protein
MSPPPATPRVYHITHVNNLPAIIANGGLISDAAMIARGGPAATIGMGTIKQRRLTLPVKCHPGLNVGDCVPFYFCPRSIMLFVIHCANHPELTYRGGQGPSFISKRTSRPSSRGPTSSSGDGPSASRTRALGTRSSRAA